MFAAVRTAAHNAVAAPPRTAPAPRRAGVSGPVARSPPTTRTSADVRLTGLVQPSAAHALGCTNTSRMPTIAASAPPRTRRRCRTSPGLRGPGTSPAPRRRAETQAPARDAGVGAGEADATGGAERGVAGIDAVGTGVAACTLGAGTASGTIRGHSLDRHHDLRLSGRTADGDGSPPPDPSRVARRTRRTRPRSRSGGSTDPTAGPSRTARSADPRRRSVAGSRASRRESARSPASVG